MFYAYCLFSQHRKPLAAGYIDASGEKVVLNINGKGCGTTLYESRENADRFTIALVQAIEDNDEIQTAGFKQILNGFAVPIVQGLNYNVYDHAWETLTADETAKSAMAVVSRVLDRLQTAKVMEWKRVFANAAVAYQALENRGVCHGFTMVRPVWWQTTYSGRSKNTGCNIQGSDGNDMLRLPSGGDDDYFVYFDWVAADMRVAAELSGDEGFLEAFRASDPYTVVAGELVDVPRAECKKQLLKALNSFNYDHELLTHRFPRLGEWLRESRRLLDDAGGLESILGRKFTLNRAKDNNPRAVLNGVLQGSVAHAMQLSAKRIWDLFGDRLLVEIHDSVAMVANDDSLRATVKEVVRIMTRPFSGVLESDPFFPVKVSIGKRFRDWQPMLVYREGGVEHVRGQEEAGEGTEEAAPESDADGAVAATAET